MANEFVVRNGLIVSGSTYLEAISQSNEAYILSYDSVTNEVAYMPTSSVVVTVPGADTQIIYNNGGVFGASSNLVFSGSRVGIGSANPAYTLDVNGVLNVASSTVALRIGGTVALGRGLSTDGTRINGGSTDGIEFTPNNDNTIKVVIKPNGNVGIGTTNPAALLDVEGGELRVGDGAGSHTGFTFSGGLVQTNNNYVQLKGALQVLSTAGQNSYITGSGCVGIGTTNPATKLHVSKTDSSNELVAVRVQNNLGYSEFGVQSNYARILANGALLYAGSDGAQYFYYNGSVVMTVGTGNVGIGTASPAGKLHVSGTILLENNFALQSKDASGTARRLAQYTSGNAVIFGSDTSHILQLASNGATILQDNGTDLDIDPSTAGGDIILLTNQTGGSVGIGTATPAYKLDVNGSFRVDGTNGDFIVDATGNDVYFTRNGTNYFYANQASSAISFQLGAGYSQSLFLKNDGNVGIGTASPSQPLHIFTAGATPILLERSTSNANVSAQFKDATSSWYIGKASNGYFAIGGEANLGAVTIFNITTGGNVGIGTNSPTHKLTVLGAVSASSFTGSFSGTSTNAISASFAATASSADDFYVRSTATVGSNFQIDSNGDFYQKTTGGAAIWSAVGNTTYPSYAFYNDLGLGMYRAAEDTLAFTTSGSERVRITSDGNLAINSTSTSGYRLYVNGSTWINGGTNFVDGVTILRTESGASEVMRIASGGNVGIGTTNPLYKLHVVGSTYVNSGTLFIDSGEYIRWGNSAQGIRGVNDTSLEFVVGSSTRMYVSSSGNVGIGTTNPNNRLDVAGSVQVSSTNFFRYDGDTGIVGSGTGISGGTSTQLGIRAANEILFATSGANERMRINSAGNVGIGTTSPSVTLDVTGTARITSTLLGGGRISAATEYRLNDNSYSRVAILDGGGAFAGGYNFNINSGTAQHDSTGAVAAYYYNSAGYISLFTNSSQAAGTAAAERMRITSAGSIGVGTSSPAEILELSTTTDPKIRFVDVGNLDAKIGIVGSTALGFEVNGSERMRITSTGNVGIGTSSPDVRLHVNEAGTANTQTIVLGLSSTSTRPMIQFSESTGVAIGNGMSIEYDGRETGANNKMYINGTDNAPKLTVMSGGNIGIGISSPTALLHVSGGNSYMDGNLTVTGAITAQELYVQYISSSIIYSTGSNKFGDATNDIQYFTGSILQSGSLAYFAGNVGIGTASPTRQLELAGSDAYIQLTRSSTSTQATLGFNTGATNDWLIRTGDGSTSDLQFYSYGNSSYVMTIARSSGNVGIGTATPNYKLEVSGSTNVYHRLDVGTGIDFPAGTSNAIATFKQAGSVGGIILQEAGGTSNDRILKLNSNGDEQSIEATYRDTGPYGNLAFKTGGSIRMYISSSGNIGIGTTTVYNRLHVVASGTTLMSGSAGRGITVTDTTGPRLVLENPSAASNTRNWVIKNDLGFLSFSLLDDQGTAWVQDNAVNIVPSGNLGIGTTSPGEKLDILGSGAQFLRIANVGTYLMRFGIDASNNGYIGSSNATPIGFYTNSVNRIHITTDGNVGIGTTSPTLKLDVIGNARIGQTSNSSTDAKIELTSGGSGYNAFIDYGYWDTFDASLWRAGVFGDDSSKFKIQNTGAGPVYDVFVINGTSTFAFLTGSVGIGTASPGAKLQITGGTLDGASLTDLGISSGLTTGRLGTFDANSLASISTRGDASSVELAAGSSATYYTGISATANNATSFTGTLRFFTSGSEKVRITPSGNVGIGTTNPAYKLDVRGAINSSTATTSGTGSLNLGTTAESIIAGQILGTRSPSYASTGKLGFSVSTWGVGSDYGLTEVMAIDMRGADSKAPTIWMNPFGGNVGIGTTSPAGKLHIADDGPNALRIGDTQVSTIGETNDGGYPGMKIVPYNSNIHIGISSTNDNKINLWYGGTNYTYWQQLSTYSIFSNYSTDALALQIHGGNVGIGITNPNEKLHVAGNIHAYAPGGIDGGLYASTSGGSTTIAIRSNGTTVLNGGNVGIGTSSPANKLHVVHLGGLYNATIANQTDLTGSVIISADSSGLNSRASLVLRGSDAIGGAISVAREDTGATWRTYMSFYTNNLTGGNVGDIQEKMRINADGNVGIGTTSPSSRLSIQNSGTTDSIISEYRMTNGSNAATFRTDDNVIFGIHAQNAGDIYIKDASDKVLFYGKNGGNVGIGTTSPNARLEVSASSGTGLALLSYGNIRTGGIGSSGGEFIASGKFGNSNVMRMYHDDTNGYIQVDNVVYAGHLILQPTSNVGIGTTNPSNKLEVLGSATIRNSSGGGALNVGTNSGRTEYQYVTLGGGTGGTDYGWQVGRSPQTGGVINDGFYIYDIKTNNAPFAIALGGNVGIGTTNPSTKLHVAGAAILANNTSINPDSYGSTVVAGAVATAGGWGLSTGIGGNAGVGHSWALGSNGDNFYMGYENGSSANSMQTFLQVDDSTRNLFLVPSSGNVGIGTTSPNFKLQVDHGTGAQYAASFRNTNDNLQIKIGTTTGSLLNIQGATISTNAAYNIALQAEGGNVGIGTTSPAAKLDVNGGAIVRNDLALIKTSGNNTLTINSSGGGTPVIYMSSPSRMWGQYVDVNDLHLKDETGNIVTMVLKAGGNVGIGTTNPGAKLHVYGTGSTELRIGSSTGNTNSLLSFYEVGIASWGIDAGQANGSFFIKDLYNTRTVVTLNNTGNVGIGTTSPDQLFVVANSATDAEKGVIIRNSNAGTSADASLRIDGYAGSFIDFYRNSGLRWKFNRIAFSDDFKISAAGAGGIGDVMYFDYDTGNVGIGTTSPLAILDVYQAGQPQLRVRGTTGANHLYQDSTTGTTINDGLFVGIGGDQTGYVYHYESKPLVFATSNTERVRIAADGNVGFFTSTPTGSVATNLVHVDGGGAVVRVGPYYSAGGDRDYIEIQAHPTDTRITSVNERFHFTNAGGVVVLQDTGGSVGIGTTNPSQKLSVVGDFAIANTTSIQESRIGKYQSGSLGSGTHTIASVSVTGVDAVFFDYVIKNSTTDMRAGTVMAVTNGSTVEYTDISTADIGDTTRITMISDVSGGNIRLRASIDTGSGSWTVRTLIRTI